MLVGLIGWPDAKGRVLGGPGSEGMAEVEVFGIAMLMGGIPQVQSGEGLLPKAPTIRPCQLGQRRVLRDVNGWPVHACDEIFSPLGPHISARVSTCKNNRQQLSLLTWDGGQRRVRMSSIRTESRPRRRGGCRVQAVRENTDVLQSARNSLTETNQPGSMCGRACAGYCSRGLLMPQ